MTAGINPLIFRAYDIRGVVDKDLTEEVAEVLGKGIGTYLQQLGGNRIVVGRDNRLSSDKLRNGLVKGLLSTGCDVTDIGLSTSPMMYTSVAGWNMDGGINITGSHNPVEYNGFKVVARQATPIGGEQIMELQELTLSGKFATGQGRYEQRNALDEYLERIGRIIQLPRKLKVAIDTGNGVAGLTAPVMLKRLGCEVIEVFTELDGSFPHHLPNPENEAYLADLQKRVVEGGADLGIGYDGDGDRLGLIDENGRYLESDYAIMLLARDYLTRHPGATVLIDVKSSQNTIEDIHNHGGNPLLYKTGHSLVKAKMRADGIGLGGELSGHMFVFEDYFPIDDALFASARILRYLASSNKKLSEHFEGLRKRYSTLVIEIHCDDTIKFDVVSKVRDEYVGKYTVNPIDGARVDFPDGWALIRASNTAPNLAMRFEADTPQALEAIKADVFQTVQKYLPKT